MRNYGERCFTLMIELPWSMHHDFYRVSYVAIRVFEAAWYIMGQSEAKWILVISRGDFSLSLI
jgi:hypothetical protein